MSGKSLKKWQGTAAIIGLDFGDSGKGRLVDEMAQYAHVVARYGGGANAGHTVINQFGKFALHIIPSGIFNPKTLCLVGRGVAVSCESLVAEIEALHAAGVSHDNLIIDEDAQLTMPWHILRDNLREKMRSSKVGTTASGIGPTYADRIERVGLQVKDLTDADFSEKLAAEVKFQNKFFKLNIIFSKILKEYRLFAKILKHHIGKTVPIVKLAQEENKNILFEGAQGVFLDIDFGSYPYVTSSNPGVVGIWRSFDVHPAEINLVIGISKAYLTRVGFGPLPSKMEKKVAERIIEQGHEYGTTTGRQRTPGWLDLALIKTAIRTNKVSSLAITKLDVLGGLEKIKVVTSYKIAKQKVEYTSGDANFLGKCRPVYHELPGWNDDISNVRKFNDLPQNARQFIEFIQATLDVPIEFIAVGPKRGEAIYV